MTPRPRIGVLVPATNTVVEEEFWVHARDDVELLTARIAVADPRINTDDGEQGLVEGILAELDDAIESILTTRPDVVILGVSAASFRGGLRGLRELELTLEAQAGVPVIAGARALLEELTLTSGVGRVAYLSPYHATNDRLVEQLLTEGGFEVAGGVGLQIETATAIAEVSNERVLSELRDLAHLDVDALVQVGTNLRMLHLDRDAPVHLGVPLLPINRCLLQTAYRRLALPSSLPKDPSRGIT